MKRKIKIVKEIKDKGYHTNHPKYNKCHRHANKKEKELTGEVYRQPHKKGTLLGSYTKDGKIIFISQEVPVNKHKNIEIHENAEIECMIDGD